MDNLETIMQQNQEIVKEAVIDYLERKYCPNEFGLNENCIIPFYKILNKKAECRKCWNQALKKGLG